MRILVLTQFFWPEARTAPTNLAALCADLRAAGHEVLVITGFPNHPFGKVYDGYQIKAWQWDEVHGVRVLRLPLYPDHSNSLSRRALNYGSFAFMSATMGAYLTADFKPDVIFTYFAPVTIGSVATWLSRFHGVPLVYWITDLWPENLAAVSRRSQSRTIRMMRRLEGWSYRQAAALCVDSPGFVSNLLGKGVPPEKLHVVAEWADPDLFHPSEPDPALAAEHGLACKFNVVYGGSIGPAQGLETVLDAAKLLANHREIQFVMIGGGSELESLRRSALAEQITNVKFLGHQSMEHMHRFFALADVLLVHLTRKPIFALQLPSKLLAYLACGRPVLCAVEGTAAQIVRDAQAGVTCSSEDPQVLAEQVRQFFTMPARQRQDMGQRGRAAYLAGYSRCVQVARVEKILEQVVQQTTGRQIAA